MGKKWGDDEKEEGGEEKGGEEKGDDNDRTGGKGGGEGDDKDGGDDESLGEDIFLILLCVYAPFHFQFKMVNDFFGFFIWTSDPKSCFLKVQSFVFMDPSNMTF